MKDFFAKNLIVIVTISILLLFVFIPNNEDKPIEIIEEPSSISLGENHSALLTEDGRMFMWGSNEFGQLGNGEGGSENDLENTPIEITDKFVDENDEQVDLTDAQISLGFNHSSLLTNDGILFIWGRNNYGQLGDTTPNDLLTNKNIPTNISSFFDVDKEKDLTDSKILLGGDSSSLLTSDGRLFTWGNNYYGQLGDGSEIFKMNPNEITNKFVDNNQQIDLTNAQILIKYSHSSLLTENGRLFMWGLNDVGQLGNGTTNPENKPYEITNQFINEEAKKVNLEKAKISIGFDHSSLLTEDGRLFMWGLNNKSQLGDNGDNNMFSKSPFEINEYFEDDEINLENSRIALGFEFSSLLTEDGRMFTWGSNTFGQLGDGTGLDKGTPTEITDLFIDEEELIDLTEAHISMGWKHSSLMTKYGRSFMWGSNDYGEIGNGNDEDIHSPLEIIFV